MGHLYLVRHGQASLGSDDYDQLSPLGQQQSQRLGEHWQEQGHHFDAVFTGTLRRHTQTLAGIQAGMGAELPQTATHRLNEYDSEALIRAIEPRQHINPCTPEGYRHYFRLLREGLAQWMAGTITPENMPSYSTFVQGIVSVLDEIRQHHTGNVLLVSSGGPIATAAAHVLNTSPRVSIELNMRLRNTAVSEFSFTPKRHSLVSFNHLAHLETPQHKHWATFA